MKIIPIVNINTIKGTIPDGYELIVHEKNGNVNDGFVLYGFDEIGMFDSEFDCPTYSFVSIEN
jgi:hypothetical protein